MASFDIIETSGKAYIKAWEERQYLLRLALLPFLIKAAFFAAVLVLGYEHNIIRQTLVMLPAYFMEGWLAAHVVRLAFFDEKGSVSLQATGQEEALLYRGRAIFASIIVYVLIKMIQGAFLAPLMYQEEELQKMAEQGENEPTFMVFLVSIFLLMALVWAFKFICLYVPVAAHISFRRYLTCFSGMGSSLYLLGAWLVCFVPFIMV